MMLSLSSSLMYPPYDINVAIYPARSSENPFFPHPHPIPPLEGEDNFLSLRERIKVRVGIFMYLCKPPAHDGSLEVHLCPETIDCNRVITRITTCIGYNL